MEIKEFEDMITNMPKPELSHLRHQSLLLSALSKAKHKFTLSFWWIAIPLFVIAVTLMESLFFKGTRFYTVFSALQIRHDLAYHLLFLALPLTLIVLNIISLRNYYKIHLSPQKMNFLRFLWPNLSIIIFSILVLIVYLIF